jgi:hypothetical protein
MYLHSTQAAIYTRTRYKQIFYIIIARLLHSYLHAFPLGAGAVCLDIAHCMLRVVAPSCRGKERRDKRTEVYIGVKAQGCGGVGREKRGNARMYAKSTLKKTFCKL